MKFSCRLAAVMGLSLLGVATLPATVFGESLLDVYEARLCGVDHLNSSGKALKKVAEIIRQDRANYHKLGHRDEEDEYDSVFSQQRNRDLLERKIARGHISASARRSILYGTPLIRVKVYPSYVDISILDD